MINMKICPNCKRSLDDDSAYCGYCDTKLPYVPEEEEEAPGGGAGLKNNSAPPVSRRCENCGEPLEENFDTCWKCGAVAVSGAESRTAGVKRAAAAPIMSVCGLAKTLEVYPDRIFIATSGIADMSGLTGYVAPCEIPIKDISYIQFTSTKEAVVGNLVVNYTVQPPEDTADAVSLSESVLFGAEAEQEMAAVPELIKRCRTELDAQAGEDAPPPPLPGGEDAAGTNTASNEPDEAADS